MSTTYIDIEPTLAASVKAYLDDTVADEILATCPCVTFYDPMSIDDANRCTVLIPAVVFDVEYPGNFEAEVEIGIKSQWQQATIADDLASHQDRVRAFRTALWSDTLRDDITAAGNVNLWHIAPERQGATEVRENWYYTSTVFKVRGGIKEA